MTNQKAACSNMASPPQMQSNLIDLTHDTLPEIVWRPIKKIPEAMPPGNIINDKVNLQQWEIAMSKDFYSYTFNRIYFDNEVFKAFISNGKIIKMLVDPKDLADAKDFWKQEEDITRTASNYIKELKNRKVYDFHAIKPQAYDLRAGKDQKNKKVIKREGK
jgi:hypothetical protein